MLSADIAVVRSFCFFLSKRQNLLGPLSKSLKRIQGPYPSWTTSSTTRWGQHLLNASAVPGGTSAPNITSNSATGFQLRGGAVKHLLERIGRSEERRVGKEVECRRGMLVEVEYSIVDQIT